MMEEELFHGGVYDFYMSTTCSNHSLFNKPNGEEMITI